MTRPLDGILVLDFSRVLSGPHCARMLSDLGADVIKLEPPEGDGTRHAQPRISGISVYFTQQNCGKRNVSIDLRQPEGARVALELAARCDVVLENYRPGVLDRLGIGYEAVRERNPKVVYCSISGYGQDGPTSQRRAYAPTMHAEIGFIHLAADRRGTDPMSEALSHGDLYPALHAALAITSALLHRERTGEGQRIDVSMAESLLTINEWTATELAGGDGGLPHVFGGANAPVLRMGNGTWICVPGNPVASFPAWVAAMERPELLDEARFATPEARQQHRAAMLSVLADWVGQFTSFPELEAALGKARLAVGEVRSLVDAARSDWMEARAALADVDDRSGGTLKLARSPWRFSALEDGVRGVAAYRGEHNREVLRELLGMRDEEISQLEGAGVLSSRLPGD